MSEDSGKDMFRTVVGQKIISRRKNGAILVAGEPDGEYGMRKQFTLAMSRPGLHALIEALQDWDY